MSDLAFALLLTLGGALLVAHCSRMTWREVRAGVAKAGYAGQQRAHQPALFRITIIVGNALAAFLGTIFLMAGLLLLIAAMQ